MYLLDTHVLLWFLNDAPLLPVNIKKLIGKSKETIVFVSIASFWEMAIKDSKGKLTLAQPIPDIMKLCSETLDMTVLNIRDVHLETLRTLPWVHKDPFDRLMISQAISEKLTLISADQSIAGYSVRRLWV